MGYYLPIKFFKVSPDCAICATRVVAIMDTKSYQARETIKAERRAKTLINAAGRDQAKTAIFLDNGTVIASPYSVKVLMNSIERGNGKRIRPEARSTDKIRVYDAILDEDLNEYDNNEEEEDVDESDTSDSDLDDDESSGADEDD